jgi:hypothetical protein
MSHLRITTLFAICAAGFISTCHGQGIDIYVSAAGSDAADGSKGSPFATLERARTAILATNRRPATVWLAGGDYYFNKPFELTAADSGTPEAPVTYRSGEGQIARLLGARKIDAKDFEPVTGSETLSRVSKEALGKIVVLDLRKLGVKHTKRFPDVFNDSGGLPDLFFNGRRMPLSRFPNSGYMTIKRVLYNAGGPTNWKDPKNSQQKVDPNGPGGIFEYREEFYDKHALWQRQVARGVWLKGFWRIPWQNEAIRIGSIDTVQHTVTFARPIPSGIGNKYTRPAGNGKEAYWALNLLEEIDSPGEWCVDFADGKLYFYPPGPLEKAEILLADSDEPVININGGAHIILRGFTVEAALGQGIQIKDGESNLIAGCTVRNVDKYAIRVEGGKKNLILSNDLYNLGCGGVWLSGGDEKCEPRVPAGHMVINNHIHHFSQIEHIYTPGVNCGFTGGGGGGHHPAVGNIVAHNLVHDTPHAGMLFGSWDNIFEYNEVFRFAMVSNDIGAFYSYDTYGLDGNQTFRYNLVHSSGDGDGFYWDMDHRDMHVYGNIAWLMSRGKRGTGYLYKIGSQAAHPQSIECYNNIAIECNTGYVFVSVLPNQGRIENNVAVKCKIPWTWRGVKDGKEANTAEYASGLNKVYDSDPGFVDSAHFDFRLNPDARIIKDLPGFKPIPVEKIGLYVDEYRRSLPSREEIDRAGKHTGESGLGYEILDRK